MRFYVLLAILAGGLALLILNHDSGRTLGIANDDFGRLVTLSAIGTMMAAGILAGRRQWGESLRQAAIWLVLILALATAYLYRFDLQDVGNRLTAGLIPGRAVVTTNASGEQILVIQKGLSGHFETDVTIDGTPLRMMVDTGASSVVLSYADAMRLGINPDNLVFSIDVSTANGRALAAPVTLRQVAIGPIQRGTIRGMVAQEGRLEQSLLGMSFLETLGSIEITRDELRLKD
ncbi:TIGR02281 family clan AA aspartic protease [Shinella sp. AETb1-6]|jgi:aspartyl protease family protein|uniref:TIGR02281 family clan AA aspartic protease n=1 Tax=Shinella sumterensis TaxID=1967501 RepID=A0AA50CNH6_9HYPH|nr:MULTISPECIES: TIGR02281 family clan AA aspartic protease [Shinella]MCD1263538.1 TIGR02281 family clan AA aspartic protease [Shinella sumterensis]MXN49565.1 TIGR02281 family clan AA aspartic protease [Shinella sp. AETb1-6]TFE97529.1 aspartic protease [Shinella sumterensis]WLR98383.1 TIGR02281 family clan AA aspartic protease [Shinella sumterensis]